LSAVEALEGVEDRVIDADANRGENPVTSCGRDDEN